VDYRGDSVPAHSVGIPPSSAKVFNGAGVASYFRDGTTVEFNTTQAHTCITDVYAEIARGKIKVQKILPSGMKLSSRAAVPYNLKKWAATTPDDALRFGCKPSYCGYDLTDKIPDIDAASHEWRYAGAHLHASTDNIESSTFKPPYCHPNEAILLNSDDYPLCARVLDGYLGLAGTYLWDDLMQFQRRKYYGQAGEFRPQKYTIAKSNYRIYGDAREKAIGMEYRTLPPELFDNEETAVMFMTAMRWVFHNWREVAAKWDKGMEPAIRNAINTGNGVEGLLRRFSVPRVYDFDKLKAMKHPLQLAMAA
jgi:hypothetical protein